MPSTLHYECYNYTGKPNQVEETVTDREANGTLPDKTKSWAETDSLTRCKTKSTEPRQDIDREVQCPPIFSTMVMRKTTPFVQPAL